MCIKYHILNVLSYLKCLLKMLVQHIIQTVSVSIERQFLRQPRFFNIQHKINSTKPNKVLFLDWNRQACKIMLDFDFFSKLFECSLEQKMQAQTSQKLRQKSQITEGIDYILLWSLKDQRRSSHLQIAKYNIVIHQTMHLILQDHWYFIIISEKMNKLLFILLLLTLLGLVHNQVCPNHCNICSNSTSCTQCESGFFLDRQNACRRCPEGCSICQATQEGPICSVCLDEYQLDQGHCFRCNPICSDQGCTSHPDNCVSCDLGFELIDGEDGEKKCVPLQNCKPQNCGACQNDDSEICETCLPSFFTFLGKCEKCRFPCTECTFPSDTAFSSSANSTIATYIGLVQTELSNSGTPKDIEGLINRDTPTTIQKEIMVIVFYFFDYLINEKSITQDQIVTYLATHEQELEDAQIIENIFDIAAEFYTEVTNEEIEEDEIRKILFGQVHENNICSKCAVRFGLNPSSQCEACVIGCLKCQTNLECSQCEPELSLDGNSCTSCEGNCRTCEDGNPSVCTSCVPPFSLSSGSCIQCKSPCKTCSQGSEDVCITCIKPFSQDADADGKCFRCDEDLCSKCLEDDTSVCLICADGASLADGKCSRCPRNCIECGGEECYVCEKGYFLEDDEKCKKCGTGCIECQDQEQCLQCLDGLYLNSESKCKPCKPGCSSCASEECDEYEDGNVEFQGEIVQCREGCDQCDPIDPEKCTRCSPKFYLDVNVCRKCGRNCDICVSESECTECKPNTNNNGDGTCEKCKGECRTCSPDDPEVCLSCKSGFALIQDECKKICQDHCIECDLQNPDICLQAAHGYAIKSDGSLVKCLGKCSGSCDPRDVDICTSCLDGFQLIEGECIRCPPGCSSCIDGDCQDCHKGFELRQQDDHIVCKPTCKAPCRQCEGDICLGCSGGFILENGKCQIDLSCNPECEFCPLGTYVSAEDANGKTCTKCATNCASCDDSECFSCFEGFYENQGSCEKCSSNCRICDDAESCEVCANGFFLPIIAEGEDGEKQYSDTCEPCSSQCKTCTERADQCLSCGEDRTEKGFTCFTRLAVNFLLEFDIDFEQFKEDSTIQQIVEKMTEILGVEATQIFLDQIFQGSTNVEGSAQTDSAENGAIMAEKLANGDYGYKVISSSVGVFYDGEEVKEEIEQPIIQPVPEEENIGLIVGVVVGGVVILAIIGLIIYKVKFASKNMKKINESQRQSIQDFRNKQTAAKPYENKVIYN